MFHVDALRLPLILPVLLVAMSHSIFAETRHPQVLVQHSANTDRIGLLLFSAGWGTSAPLLSEYANKSIDQRKLEEILRRAKETIDTGRTSVVAMLNSGIFLDARERGSSTPLHPNAEYQAQLRRYFLDSLFRADSPPWRSFLLDPGVAGFEDGLSDEYQAVERYLGNFLRLGDEILFLEKVFRFGFQKYVVVPSFFFLPRSGSGFPAKVGGEDWAYFQLGALRDLGQGETPNLSTVGFNRTSEIARLAVHELGHAFYGLAIRDRYQKQIAGWSTLFSAEMAKKMRALGYSDKNWEGVFEEHFVRSLEVIFLEQHGTSREADELREYEKSLGFTLIDRVIEGINLGLPMQSVQGIVESIDRELLN